MKMFKGSTTRFLTKLSAVMCLLLLLFTGSGTLASTHNYTLTTKQIVKRIAGILDISDKQKRNIKLKERFEIDFNYTEFEKLILADTKNKFSKTELSEFSKNFHQLLLIKIVAIIDKTDFTCKDYNIQSLKKDTMINVSCNNGKDNNRVTLHFKTGTKQIMDFTLGDVLLSRNYRGTFNKIIRRDGVHGLLSKIRSRLNPANSSPSDNSSLL
ncbi:MAG: ABC transporter substrate-binding protein [Deltaproteobacteria bacterium]|nr:ABC transporter substrate-binding protein [Deltaproteobacteria bacterium]